MSEEIPPPDTLSPVPDASAIDSLSDWLESGLFGRRIVFLSGFLDSSVALRLAAELMTLDARGAEPIDLYIDSADGTIEAAFALIDTLDLLSAPTRTHGLGQVGGPAIAVLAVGDSRTAARNARFHLADPRTRASGTAAELASQSDNQLRLLARFHERLAKATGHSVSEVREDLGRGRYLDSTEALAYGLVDAIAEAPQAS